MRVLRYSIHNNALFNSYLDGKMPTIEEIKTHAFLAERALGNQKPDHYFKNTLNFRLSNINKLSEFLLTFFESYCSHFLKISNKEVFVKRDLLEDWQTEISRLTTLPFIAFVIWKKFGAPKSNSPQDISRYSKNSGLTQFTWTTLLTSECIDFDYIANKEYLNDLHIHLNGTTEIDSVWLHTMTSLERFSAQFLSSLNNEPTKEMMLQIDPKLDHQTFLAQLRVVRRARLAMCQRITRKNTFLHASYLSVDYGLKNKNFDNIDEDQFDLSKHPFPFAIHNHPHPSLNASSSQNILAELLMWILCFNSLSRGDNSLARFCHFYLLGQNSRFVPMCVQSSEHVGFDQFQKFTMNEVRELSEKHYSGRFFQLNRKINSDTGLIEGRFAPKSDRKKLINLLNSIFNGYKNYLITLINSSEKLNRNSSINIFTESELPTSNRFSLSLIIHFIKQKDELHESSLLAYRHYRLRVTHQKQWQVFKSILQRSQLLRKHFKGIDGAANELHAPPEVFAPLFRQCVEDGYGNITFHVGEDFQNLVSGIRAVAEAVRFLPMSPGCRLGHATAIGIAPSLWLRLHRDELVTSQGELFDDLVFARVYLQGFSEFSQLIEAIDSQIYTLAQKLFPAELNTLPVPVYFSAWELRKLDPEFFDKVDSLTPPSLIDHKNNEWRELKSAKSANPVAFKIFQYYHSAKYAAQANILTNIKPDLLPEKALIRLQQVVQKQVNSRELVLEALPTSNIRISHYKYYKEHHIYRWLKPEPESGDQRMRVVLGSDDPGIFATSIRNEFLHVYRILEDHDCAPPELNQLIGELVSNGQKYAFINPKAEL